MKNTIHILSLFLLALIFTGCSEDTLDTNDPDVKTFVRQLKAGKYNTTNENGVIEIPRFSQKHRPDLLKYADDMTEIPSFPLTTMSSHFGGKPRLGECMLWIIEGIRLGSPPSMGCKLLHKDADSYDGVYFLDNEQVTEVAVLYRKWWDKVQNASTVWSIELLMYDPLQTSNYRWW